MPEPGEVWRRVARATQGEDYARGYAGHFARIAAAGEDVHGEAAYVAGLLAPGSSVLDAGCGTGRVAARLADLGFDVVGVDVDAAMVQVARAERPELTWVVADLGALDLGRRFDLVVLAGNVVPFIDPSALPVAVARLADHLRPGGRVVCGFGLDEEHLPTGGPVVTLAAYDEACGSAGLELVTRHAGWDATPYDGGGYAVSVHARRTDRRGPVS
ncbi:class I SAM-dependent methyltransferase [Nocardioides caldifontis]|uniref:class I SAM-dependent methyltransferase n=1 Tax=Nocardioides caldifontis TaxID=2588938 RepID=UPI0011DF0C19|nr:class I SAM-dependent methyltransferase [Nocardioides caldifontis]